MVCCYKDKSKDKTTGYIFPASAICLFIASSFFLNYVNWSEPVGAPLEVGVIQPNTPIEEKWKLEYQNSLITKLATLSEQLSKESKSELIIWPETALPLYTQQTNQSFWQSIKPQGAEILTGIMDSPNSNGRDEIYNAAVLTCKGGVPTVYRKAHLVPFGEYLPLRFLFNWVLEYLHRQMAGDATVLVNISEDAWFGDSFAPHQRKQMAQMRAAELARPLVRSANSGPSLFIDVKGRVLLQTAQFEVAAVSHLVQPYDGDTLFKRFGNWVIYLSLFVLLLLFFVSRVGETGAVKKNE